MKRILITGASGMLGAELCLSLQNNFDIYSYEKSSARNSKGLDITNIDEVNSAIAFVKPDIIINCAAFTNVDNAEMYKTKAREVNVVGLSNILKTCLKDVKIIHISTDYIFDGSKGNYLESSIKNPLNYYGKTKLEAENYLVGSNYNYLILRPNVLYGNNLKSSNFFSWVMNSLLVNKNINIVDDQLSNPAYIPDFVSVIQDSILLDYSGISHFGSEDVISRYDFAMKICKYFNLDHKLIKSLRTSDLNQIAKRPLNTSLNCSKIESDLDINLYSTNYSLERIKTSL